MSSAFQNVATQEMPPPDIPKIRFKRSLPRRGPSSVVIIIGSVAFVSFGYWMKYKGMCIEKEIEREKIQARLHLEPYLQAERDAEWVRRRALIHELTGK